jgi:hypothetical protein
MPSSTAMIKKSNFRPVLRAFDWCGPTSLVRLRPSGVSSKIQAKTSATGNPRITKKMTSLTLHRGTAKNGNVWVAI